MNRHFVVTSTVALLACSAARADIPLPPHLHYVDPRVAFEGVEKYPDYVFCFRFLTFVGGPGGTPHRVVEVRDAKPFAMKAQRRIIDTQLLAMDRKEFEKRAQADKSLAWLTDETEGVLAAEVDAPSTTALRTRREAPVTKYRAVLKEGKLTVATDDDETSEPMGMLGVLPDWMAGIALAGALACVGFLFIRRTGAGAPTPARPQGAVEHP